MIMFSVCCHFGDRHVYMESCIVTFREELRTAAEERDMEALQRCASQCFPENCKVLVNAHKPPATHMLPKLRCVNLKI